MPLPNFQGYQTQSALPERAESVLPPALAGEVITPSKLHAFRRTLLHNIAKAFGIDVPKDATKNEMLPALIAAEQRGIFRGQPTDEYHYLMAMRDPDVIMAPHEEEAFEAALRKARLKGLSKRDQMIEKNVALKEDPNSIQNLRKKAKGLGIDSWGKSAEWIIEQIEQKERENAQAAVAEEVERLEAE